MSIEKLTKRLQGSIDFALDNEEDLDAASWNYQEGILITVNEAKLLLDIVKNCSIPDVVGQSEQLVSFLRQYQKACDILHVNKIDAINFVKQYKTN